MEGIRAGTLLRRSGVTPLVRAAHSQLEVDYLPPYGDPEVNIPAEIATYVLAGGLAVALFDRIEE